MGIKRFIRAQSSSVHDLSAGLFWLSCLGMAGCGGAVSTSTTATPPALYSLTVNSTDPTSGVAIVASPADKNASTGGNSSLTLTYSSGTTVTLTAPSTAGIEIFSAWTGCTQSFGTSCTLTLSGNTTVTANYKSAVSVVLTPGSTTLTIGQGIQFAVSVTGTTNTAVTWILSAPSGSTLSPGTLSAANFYQSPFPAPAYATVTVVSSADTAATASAVITLNAPATASGPTLTVNTSSITHTISPLIYGMNNYTLPSAGQLQVVLPLDRWGGDTTTRYNYLLDVANLDSDWYFETLPNSNTAYPDVSQFNSFVQQNEQISSTTLATVPLIGYTTLRQRACSFSVAKYGAQQQTDPYWSDCGNSVLTNGKNVTGNNPADTSTPINQTFVGGWVSYLVKKFGPAANGGVSIYALDNEPEFWDGVHRDVHPAYMTYDEVTNKGLAYAQAIKTADPTAQVSGPVIANWPNYFYSSADLHSGWSTGPCWCYNGNPTDRMAHGNVPLLAYYLQQFQAAQNRGGVRLLDYLDLHGYYAASGATFTTAGDTALQAARLNSTRALWDPTYTDPAETDPNVTTNAPAYPVQLIPMMKSLVAANYPGTKLAITEYNWGAQESVNGALAQAEVLAIFGAQGLDMGALWGQPDPVKQLPGLLAFQLFQSYDGNGSAFGDGSLAATSSDQSKLSIYAAKRSKDNMLTVLVLNKSFGTLTSNVSLTTSATSAQVFQYSNANTSAIVKQANVTVTQPSGGGAASVAMTFPAQSMTLLVMPR
jgi:hypothetical protein